MDAMQFQAAVVAWGAAATTLIGVMVAVGVAIRGAIERLTAKSEANRVAIAAVTAKADSHETQLNGALSTLVAAAVRKGLADSKGASDGS